MTRVRRRLAPGRRQEWPLTVEEELVLGVDLDAFASRLARFFAVSARDFHDDPQRRAAELALARDIETGAYDWRAR